MNQLIQSTLSCCKIFIVMTFSGLKNTYIFLLQKSWRIPEESGAILNMTDPLQMTY